MRLSRADYHQLVDDLDLTQVGLARLLDVSDVTSRRWARSGVSGIPAILLALMRRHVTVEDILEVNSPRAGALTRAQAHERRLANVAAAKAKRRRRK